MWYQGVPSGRWGVMPSVCAVMTAASSGPIGVIMFPTLTVGLTDRHCCWLLAYFSFIRLPSVGTSTRRDARRDPPRAPSAAGSGRGRPAHKVHKLIYIWRLYPWWNSCTLCLHACQCVRSFCLMSSDAKSSMPVTCCSPFIHALSNVRLVRTENPGRPSRHSHTVTA